LFNKQVISLKKNINNVVVDHTPKKEEVLSGEIQKKSSKMRTRKGDGVVSLSLSEIPPLVFQ
jgi:hypothetical protein